MTYLVRWEQDVPGANPHDAAVKARELMRDTLALDVVPYGEAGSDLTLIPDEDAAVQVFVLPSDDPLAKLTDVFAAYVTQHSLPQGDALELLLWPDLTEAQHRWLSAFIILWDLTQKEADAQS